MEPIRNLVECARSGDEQARLDAFGELVRRFQDMAYGYAYARVGDFHLAEDAAQEAFVTAYGRLAQLHDPSAFPGWFRRIVLSACTRLTRRPSAASTSLVAAAAVESTAPEPSAAASAVELRDRVHAAIRSLPDAQRDVTALFYMGGHSQADIAEFLEVPATTVNNRLHASRQSLKRRMVAMVEDGMRSRPLPPEFPQRIRLLLELPRPLQIEGHPVRSLWERFRDCYPDFEVIELPEVMARDACLLDPEHQAGRVWFVDEMRMLRTDLTAQLVERWLASGGGPCRWIAVGRVFRREAVNSVRLETFHQAELFWAGAGLDEGVCDLEIRRVAAHLTPGIPFEPGARMSYVPVSQATSYGSPWRGDLLHSAAGGMYDREWVVKGGLDPERFGVVGFAFGLDRTAQILHGLDDIRALWRPPFVAA